MNASYYTSNAEVQQLIQDLRDHFAQQEYGRPHVSDIVDDIGFQYVDLVLEGGGTLGVAFLGYVYVLEQMDIRFLQLAGTSAGSIVSMLLAGGGAVQDAKSDWLIEAVATKDFYDFVDGGKEVEDFIDEVLKPDPSKRKAARYSRKVLDDLKEVYGLNPGAEFHRWVTALLQEKSVFTLTDLSQVRAIRPPGLKHRESGWEYTAERFERIALVSADLSTETKVVFPEMASLFYANPQDANPADFVRASMSVPIFFYPFVLENLPNDAAAADRWAQLANYHGTIPPKVYFADGGIMSNFPISLFHKNGVPDAPTFGVKIGLDRNNYNANASFGQYLGAALGAMMSFSDNDFIVQHPDYRHLVGFIDSGDYNWLDFSISDEGKLDLFVRGAQAAAAFLKGFDWEKYKMIRSRAGSTHPTHPTYTF